MKTVTVEFAGRTYEVEALPIRQARVWRQHLEERMGGALTAFREVGALAMRNFDNPDELLVAGTNTVLQQFAGLFTTVVRSSDLVAECVFEFSPALAKERKWIETHATDEEMTRAFITILGLAYPFGSWAELIQSLGLWARTMRTSSADPSSESGPMSSAEKKERD
jgi:hypothetical protein